MHYVARYTMCVDGSEPYVSYLLMSFGLITVYGRSWRTKRFVFWLFLVVFFLSVWFFFVFFFFLFLFASMAGAGGPRGSRSGCCWSSPFRRFAFPWPKRLGAKGR